MILGIQKTEAWVRVALDPKPLILVVNQLEDVDSSPTKPTTPTVRTVEVPATPFFGGSV